MFRGLNCAEAAPGPLPAPFACAPAADCSAASVSAAAVDAATPAGTDPDPIPNPSLERSASPGDAASALGPSAPAGGGEGLGGAWADGKGRVGASSCSAWRSGVSSAASGSTAKASVAFVASAAFELEPLGGGAASSNLSSNPHALRTQGMTLWDCIA